MPRPRHTRRVGIRPSILRAPMSIPTAPPSRCAPPWSRSSSPTSTTTRSPPRWRSCTGWGARWASRSSATVTQTPPVARTPATVIGSGKLAELVALAARAARRRRRERRRRRSTRAGRPRHHAVAGAQPREGDRRRGAGPHGGDPGDLPPPRPLARRQGPGRDRAPAVPGRRACASRARGEDRQRGGIGGKGAGESSLELDRRKIRDRIAELTRELDGAGRGAAHAARAPPRHEPRRAGRLHQRRQVDADARADRQRGLRRRQAVRDARHDGARRCMPEARPRVLVSDTVGFIDKLPHGLVASFKSTLDEALEAGAAGPGRRRVGRRPSSASWR